MLFIAWGRNFPKSNTTVLSMEQYILGNYLCTSLYSVYSCQIVMASFFGNLVDPTSAIDFLFVYFLPLVHSLVHSTPFFKFLLTSLCNITLNLSNLKPHPWINLYWTLILPLRGNCGVSKLRAQRWQNNEGFTVCSLQQTANFNPSCSRHAQLHQKPSGAAPQQTITQDKRADWKDFLWAGSPIGIDLNLIKIWSMVWYWTLEDIFNFTPS